jgi:hypothetical protein
MGSSSLVLTRHAQCEWDGAAGSSPLPLAPHCADQGRSLSIRRTAARRCSGRVCHESPTIIELHVQRRISSVTVVGDERDRRAGRGAFMLARSARIRASERGLIRDRSRNRSNAGTCSRPKGGSNPDAGCDRHSSPSSCQRPYAVLAGGCSLDRRARGEGRPARAPASPSASGGGEAV